MDKPTPREWLAQNPGKSLQDYFQLYPPEAQSPATEPIIVPPKPKARDSFIPSLLGLALVVAIILVYPIAWTLWFLPLLFIGAVVVGYAFLRYIERQRPDAPPLRWKVRWDWPTLQFIGIILLLPFGVGGCVKYVIWNSWQRQEIIICNAYTHPIDIDWDGSPRVLQSKELLVERIYDRHISLTDPQDTTKISKFELGRGGNFFVYGPYYELLLKEVHYGRSRYGNIFLPKTKRLKQGHHHMPGDLAFYAEKEVPRVMQETAARGSMHFSVGLRKSIFHPDILKLSEDELMDEAMERALEGLNGME